MKLIMQAPVLASSGKTFSRKKAISTRIINGQTFAYQWPEEYDYPIIFNRVKHNLVFRLTQEEVNSIYNNQVELANYRADFQKNPGKYTSLRGFIFGHSHARVTPLVTDKMVNDYMDRLAKEHAKR